MSPMAIGLMLGLNQNTGGGAPAWLPQGAAYYADFRTPDRYWNGGVTDFATATSFTRSTVAEGFDSLGVHSQFAINAARRNDRGILIEKASINICQNSKDASNAAWTNTNITLGSASSDNFVPVLETVTNGVHRLFRTSGIGGATVIAPATAYAWSDQIRKRGRRYVYIRSSPDGTNRNVGFDLDTLTVTFASAGMTGIISKIGDVYTIGFSFASSTNQFPALSIGTSNAAVTNDTAPSFVGDITQGFDYLNFNAETGTVPTSPIINNTAGNLTRTADALVLKLPGSTSHDMTFIFDDDSQQTITSVAAGDYAVPTNLNRPQVKSVVWGAV